jgi:hypothetical protein
MKKNLFVILLFSLLSWKQIQDGRTKYFPKTVVYIQQVPAKENVWVFIMAGQSNMAGRGIVEPQDTMADKRILSIDAKGKLVYAKEPLHFYEPTRTGLDCGLSFGRSLLEKIPANITILMLPTAIGGSAIRQWLGDSSYRGVNLLSNFREKVALGKQYGKIKGVLWHQGESDANKERIPVYKDRLTELFTTFRNIIGDEKLPVFIGELGSYSNNKNEWLQINKVIHAYVTEDRYATVIKTDDFSHVGDTVHFNSAGQRMLGERFANAYLGKRK